MTNAVENVMTGQVWRDFCRALEQAGEVILQPEAAANPLDRAEGFRYLTRPLRIALEMNLEWSEPDFPFSKYPPAKPGALLLWAAQSGFWGR